MRTFFAVVLFVLWVPNSHAQCEFNGSCNSTISRSLTFEDDACLDGETRRYQFFALSVPSGTTIDATVQSGFFAPALQLISPNNVIVASDNNPGGLSRAQATFVTTSAGVWFVKVRNIEVGTGGPYTLDIRCRDSTEPPPPPPPYALFVNPSPLTLGRSATGQYHVTSVINGSFDAEVRVSVVNLPNGVTATPSSFIFPSPGSGRVDVTIETDDTVASGRFTFSVVGVATTGLVATASAQLLIDAPCTPVQIRTVSTNLTQYAGQAAHLSVQPTGTAPFSYQWYLGFSPNTRTPISGATSADYETPPLTATAEYWVRLANACGSRDSPTVTVTVAPLKPKRRSVRH